jgi:peptidyl-prolyl cis-trans isomerase SurA
MKKLIVSFLLLLQFIIIIPLKSKEVKIVSKIGNKILTNVDIENEYKYLVSLNSNYQKLGKNKIYNFAKDSLLREKIKENELKKYFELGVEDSFLKDRVSELYKNLGFSNLESFKLHLKKFDLRVKDIERKLEIELKWNKLIYDKYRNQIVINEEILKQKIIDEAKNNSAYNLSELIFSSNKLNEVNQSINEIGFENTVLIFSTSDSRKRSGNLGWVNELSLSKIILEKLKKVEISEITEPIQIQNGILILKLNDLKKTDISSINIDDNLKEVIKLINGPINKKKFFK